MISSTTTVVAQGATVTASPSGAATNVTVTGKNNLTNLLVDNTSANVVFVAYTTGSNASALSSAVATTASVPVPGNSSRIIAGGSPNSALAYANVSVYCADSSTVYLTAVA